MKHLMIENKGEIDPNAFLLIGASSKADDPTKIGEFGSGANYSIAWLLRNGYTFSVYSGELEIHFDTKRTIFRDKQYDTICVNGKETSFTTAMGKGWKPWFILREFWSNALDEGGAQMVSLDDEFEPDPHGAEGVTRVYIELKAEMNDAFESWDKYFCTLRDDLVGEMPGMRVYRGGDEFVVYRRGIQIYHKPHVKSAFHYDLDTIEINESRVLASEWDLNLKMIRLWAAAPVELVNEFLKHVNEEMYEAKMDWSWGSTPGDTWKEVLNGRHIIGFRELEHFESLVEMNDVQSLPDAISRLLINTGRGEHIAGDAGAKGILKDTPTDDQSRIIEESLAALVESGYDIPYSVKFARFNVRGIVARVLNDTIYLSALACTSVFYCAATIIEETEHIKTGFMDETRQFQQHFINLYTEKLFEAGGVRYKKSKNDE